MDGQQPTHGYTSPTNPLKAAILAAAMLAVAATCSLAHGQAMGKVALDPTPAAATADIAEAAAPAPLTASPAVAGPNASAVRTVAAVSAAPDAIAERDAPAADRSIETLRASLPVNTHTTGRSKLQHPAGLSMPALPVVLPAAEPAPSTPATELAMHTSTFPKESKEPDPAAQKSPANSTAAPAAASTPPAPAAKPPAPAADSIEKRPINTRITPPAAASSQPAAAATQAAAAPSTSSSLFAGAGNLAQVGAALAIVIGLIFVGKGLAKKFVPGARASGGKGVIEILARHPLAKNQSIVLVRIGSQIVALNQGKEASESVLVISDQAEVARIIGQIEGQSPRSIQAGFNNLLANARMDLERGDEDTEQESELRTISPENLDEQLEEMAAAKRQLMELRQHVRSVRDSLPRT
jgi:flagellar biogenesis protein FliO